MDSLFTSILKTIRIIIQLILQLLYLILTIMKTIINWIFKKLTATKSVDQIVGKELCPPAVMAKGFRIGAKIGSGQFATVYKAEWTQMPGVQLACKRFNLLHVDMVWREKCLDQELKVIMSLKHPNIIKAYDIEKTRSLAFIFMQYAKNGSINDYLKNKGPIPEQKAKKWFKDIMNAIVYIHSNIIAHRDVKPDNFLLDEHFNALLSDFGFSCWAPNMFSNTLKKGTICGTDGFKAPEILSLVEGHVYDAFAVDIYAMGVSLYVMIFNKNPFGDIRKITLNELLVKMKNKLCTYGKGIKISESAVSLIDLLLEADPKLRITAEKAMKHKFLQI